MSVHIVKSFSIQRRHFQLLIWNAPKTFANIEQPATVTEWMTLPYLPTSNSSWHVYSSGRYVRGTPGSRVKAPSDKPVTYLVWCQRGDAALNWKAEQGAWRGRLITCQASCRLPRGIKHYKRGWEATLIFYPRKMARVVCLEGPALLTWTAWMDDVCELPAGAAGFTDTGQNWFLNGPDWVLMVL